MSVLRQFFVEEMLVLYFNSLKNGPIYLTHLNFAKRGEIMYFERKAYNQLLEWKTKYADHYSILLEGARRVGKSTIAERFAKQEYKSYILIDFANASQEVIRCFDDITRLDLFFLRLQAVTNTTLYVHDSVIIFDEIQLFPAARQAIKYLVKDGRYHYIETGSLISIQKNVKNILIPSEEKHLLINPMDYEEFCQAAGLNDCNVIRAFYESGLQVGQSAHRTLMKNFRIYMAVGGMPQAVEAYLNKQNFREIDEVKREILRLYEEDFHKIDDSGRISSMYHAIPGQLAKDTKRYRLARAVGKKRTSASDERLLYELINSRTVNIAYNTTDPWVSLSNTKDLDSYKLYVADTGLFLTLLFIDRPEIENETYAQFLSDRLPANLGYFFENEAAQMITASGRELYYHTWQKKDSTHYYEIDFLTSSGLKISAMEIKSSDRGKHESLSEFSRTHSRNLAGCYVFSQKDRLEKNGIHFLPIYMLPCVIES